MKESCSPGARKPRRSVYLTAGLVLALAGLAAAGCGSSGSSSTGSSNTQGSANSSTKVPGTVNVVISAGPDVVYTDFLVAEQKYFPQLTKKYGVNFKYATTATGATTMAALQGSSDTIALVDPVSASSAFVAGQDVVGVFNNFVGYGVVFVAPEKDKSARGTEVSNFGDGVWGYAAAAGGGYEATQALAEKNGLSFQKLKQVATGSYTAMLPAIESGRVDIVGMASTMAATAVADGVGYVVANSNTPEFQQSIPGGQKIGSMVVMPKAFINEYPAFTQQLVNALVEARHDVQGAQPDAIGSMMPTSFTSMLKPQVLANAWTLVQPAIEATDGTFSPSQVSQTLQQEVTGGTIKSASAAEALFDNTYVNSAYTELGIARPGTS